jgi:hypothetical protein
MEKPMKTSNEKKIKADAFKLALAFIEKSEKLALELGKSYEEDENNLTEGKEIEIKPNISVFYDGYFFSVTVKIGTTKLKREQYYHNSQGKIRWHNWKIES